MPSRPPRPSLSRRGFLRRGIAPAVVYQMAAARAPLAAAGPNGEIRLGHIGTGIQGMSLLRNFHAVPGVRNIVAADLYDGHLACAAETAPGIETTKEYRRILDRKDIDAVVIATPDHWHHRMVLDALSAGKHVYCEKPLTWSIEQGADIVQAVAQSKLLLQVGSQAKTSTLTAKAREIVKSGVLGRISMVRMSDQRNSPEGAWLYPVPPDASPATIDWDKFHGIAQRKEFDPKIFFRWRCWWEYSGGVATDLFVHLLTDLHEVLDVPAPASAVSQGGIFRFNDGRSVPDVMSTIFQYPDGALVDCFVDLANERGQREIVIMGTDATLVKDRRQLTIYPEVKRPNVQGYGSSAWPKAMRAHYFESNGYTAEGRPRTPLPPPPAEKVITVEAGPQHHEHFILSMRNGTPSRENAQEGHFAAAAAHIANLSYREGRRVKFDARTGLVS
jgi:predicted dehydrogenase